MSREIAEISREESRPTSSSARSRRAARCCSLARDTSVRLSGETPHDVSVAGARRRALAQHARGGALRCDVADASTARPSHVHHTCSRGPQELLYDEAEQRCAAGVAAVVAVAVVAVVVVAVVVVAVVVVAVVVVRGRPAVDLISSVLTHGSVPLP